MSTQKPAAGQTQSRGKGMLWTGRILNWLMGALLLMGASFNLLQLDFAVKGAVEKGYPESAVMPIGIALAVGAVLYLVPWTSVLGAVILTGYLGGAVATHVIAGDSTMEMCIPVIFAVPMWLALMLQCKRLRAIFPLRT